MRTVNFQLFCFCCFLVMAGPVAAQQLTVDCDAGDDLQERLDQAAQQELTSILVRGTCVGNFEFAPTKSIQIESDGAVLESPDEGIVFRLEGSAFTQLRGFEIRSGLFGVHVSGSGAQGVLNNCDIHSNGRGVFVDHDAFANVAISDVHDNETGFTCSNGSRCALTSGTIRNNGHGMVVTSGSDAQIFNSQIVDQTHVGIRFQDDATGQVSGTALRGSGGIDMLVVERSQVDLENGTELEGGADGHALSVGMLSSVRSSRFGETVLLGGSVFGVDSAYLSLDETRIAGDVELSAFARLSLARSEVGGSVSCRTGADAACDEGATARFQGCASARRPCGHRPESRTRGGSSALDR